MLNDVTVQVWRNLTRLLRVVAFVPWTLAAIGLARHGELDGQLWWRTFLVVYGLVLLAELGRTRAERRDASFTTTAADAGST